MHLKYVILLCFTINATYINGKDKEKEHSLAQHRLTRGVTVKGEWDTWSEWSACSVTCGAGTQIRQRECCGDGSKADQRVCEGDSEESRRCAKDACEPGDREAAVETLEGNYARLHCRAAKEDDSAIHWLTPAGEDISTHSKTEKFDLEGGFLYVVHATSRDEGVYHCVVLGNDGRPHSADAPLVVRSCEKGNPCMHGGHCVEMADADGVHQYTCACTAEYTGPFCQQRRVSGGMIALIVISLLLFLCVVALVTHLVFTNFRKDSPDKTESGKLLPPPDDLSPSPSKRLSGGRLSGRPSGQSFNRLPGQISNRRMSARLSGNIAPGRISNRPSGRISNGKLSNKPSGRISDGRISGRPSGQLSPDRISGRLSGQLSPGRLSGRPSGNISPDTLSGRLSGNISPDRLSGRMSGQSWGNMSAEYLQAVPSTAGATYGSDQPTQGGWLTNSQQLEADDPIYENIPVHDLNHLYSLQRAIVSNMSNEKQASMSSSKPPSQTPSLTVRALSQSEIRQRIQSSAEKMQDEYETPWDLKRTVPDLKPFSLNDSLLEQKNNDNDEIYVSRKFVKLRAPSYVFNQNDEESSVQNDNHILGDDLYTIPSNLSPRSSHPSSKADQNVHTPPSGHPVLSTTPPKYTGRDSIGHSTFGQTFQPQMSPVKQKWGMNIFSEQVLPHPITVPQGFAENRLDSDELLPPPPSPPPHPPPDFSPPPPPPFNFNPNNNNDVEGVDNISNNSGQEIDSGATEPSRDSNSNNDPVLSDASRSVCIKRSPTNRNSNNSSVDLIDLDEDTDEKGLLDKPLSKLLSEPQLERFLKGLDNKKEK